MRLIGNRQWQTIARTGLLATLLLVLAASPAPAQAPPVPDPAPQTPPQTPQLPSGTGIQPPSNEELIEKAAQSSVKADAIWIEITTVGKGASSVVVDLNREGSCYVLRKENGEYTIAGGAGISPELVQQAFTTLTRRSIIYGARGNPVGPAADRQLVGIGMSTWDGTRVYKTQSGALETYPEEVQKIIADLRDAAEHLPLSNDLLGSIRSTFLRPAEAQRIVAGGKRLITVDDPGKDAKEYTTLEMALRLPGRDIVVPTVDDWEALETYVAASNPDQPESGEFFIRSSERIFRIQMTATVAAGDIADELEIPRARPVER